MKNRKKQIIIFSILLSIVFIYGCNSNTNSQIEDISIKDITFETENLKVSVNDEITAVLDHFGEPIDYFEAQSCFYDGKDKIYTFDGITFYTYPTEGKDYILEIQLTDDTYATNRGVMVGSNKEEIIDLYGEDYEQNGNFIQYNISETDYVYFYIIDEKVQSIGYVTE